MATPITNDADNSSPITTTGKETQEQHAPEGSLRALLRKSSNYLLTGQRIFSRRDSYQKTRRYVHLQLSTMFNALVSTYTEAFASQWNHFKRTSDVITVGVNATEPQKYMASLYISHWILDLYCSVRNCVEELSVVALNEAYLTEINACSNEYDAYLVALNAAIRPTHIVGFHEDVMFFPRFPDDSDFTRDNPFKITGFITNVNSFRAILYAIKDKRVNWKTDHLSTDLVGRPTWLFDWFENDCACAWFPLIGNYNMMDVTHAYIVGVPCTPKLAPTDDDDIQELPQGMDLRHIDVTRIERVLPRKVFADYEVESYTTHKEKFIAYLADSDYLGIIPQTRKRHRTGQVEVDKTAPGYTSATSSSTSQSEAEITKEYVSLKTYLYYSRVITKDDKDERLKALYAIILDPMQHCTV